MSELEQEIQRIQSEIETMFTELAILAEKIETLQEVVLATW